MNILQCTIKIQWDILIKKPQLEVEVFCGREGIRTPDPLGVNQVL